jgi:acetyltransferase
LEEDGQRKVAGVGRLVCDVNHETAEFGILVGDPWQGRGLGQLITEYCLEVAKRWDVKRVVAETHKQNYRMLAIFQALGFEHEEDKQDEEVVFVGKDIS